MAGSQAVDSLVNGSVIRNGEKIVFSRTKEGHERRRERGNRGGEISRGEEEEQRNREGKRKLDQKRASEDHSRRKKEEKGARGRRKIGQLYT